MTPKFRNVRWKIRSFGEVQNLEIFVALIESEGVAIFFRPCRGPLVGACVPLCDCLSLPGDGFDIFEFSGLLLSFSVFDVGSSVVAEFIVGMSSCGLYLIAVLQFAN